VFSPKEQAKMRSKKQEMKKRYNLGKVEIAKHCWGFTSLVFNYRGNGKTYRAKGTGDEKCISNFLYKSILKYSSL
jgi:hypothetical protein